MIRSLLYFALIVPCGAFAVADVARSHYWFAAFWASLFIAQVGILLIIGSNRKRKFDKAVQAFIPEPTQKHFSGNAHQRRIARRAAVRSLEA